MEYSFNNILRLTNNKAQVLQLMILNHNYRKLLGFSAEKINKTFEKIIQPKHETLLTTKDLLKANLIVYIPNKGYFSVFNSGNTNKLNYVEILYNDLPLDIKYLYIKLLSKLQRYMDKKLKKQFVNEHQIKKLKEYGLITEDDNYIYFIKEYKDIIERTKKSVRKAHTALTTEIIEYLK